MFTNRTAEKSSASWSIARLGAVMTLAALTLTSAAAGTAFDLNCVGGVTSFNCVEQSAAARDPYVRIVPEVRGEQQKAQAAARDRNWLSRCHPVVEHDIYGVARYRYAAPGCEFGLGTD